MLCRVGLEGTLQLTDIHVDHVSIVPARKVSTVLHLKNHE